MEAVPLPGQDVYLTGWAIILLVDKPLLPNSHSLSFLTLARFNGTSAVALSPAQPHYTGYMVVLVDEVSQSQAEFTAMAIQAAPNAIVVGSQTDGADGNISAIPLPGGLGTHISGIGVFYPDKQRAQRIGVCVDVHVEPAIMGIREGRNEVLEAGTKQVLGKSTTEHEIK